MVVGRQAIQKSVPAAIRYEPWEAEALRTEAVDGAVYQCPHCRKELASSPGPWNGWRLCPHCGRPGLPPKQESSFATKRIRKVPHEAPAHGVFTTLPIANHSPASVIRMLVVVSILTLAALFSFAAYAGQLQLDMVVLGITALLLFGLLIYVGKRKEK